MEIKTELSEKHLTF